MAKKKENLFHQIRSSLINDNEVLWESEIEGNRLTATVMLYCLVVLIVTLVLDAVGVFTISSDTLIAVAVPAIVELIVPALIAHHFKYEKKWLKICLLLEFVVVVARVDSVLTYNTPLLIVLPVIMSARYYDGLLTIMISIVTTLLAGIVVYCATYFGMGMVDLNMVDLLEGTVLTVQDGLTNSILAQGIDANLLWQNSLRYQLIPKLFIFWVIALVCANIARRGREMVMKQAAVSHTTSRITTELHLASEIQSNMLPNIFPAFPDEDEFDVYATMNPAREVGGDFYDFFKTDDSHLAVVIADVSGKGVPAAMFMVIAKTLIKDHLTLGLSPAEVLTKVNNILCDGNESGMFVTAWIGVLDLETGKMVYANAGHNPPLVKLGLSDFKYLKCRPGFVLAGLENIRYKEDFFVMEPDDRLFLYTDGVTESTNGNEELYGEKNLEDFIDYCINIDAVNTLSLLKQRLDEFTGDREQFDDVTMLMLDFKKYKKNREMIEKEFEAKDENLPEVLKMLDEQLEKRDADFKATMQLEIALEELFINIAHYAYKDLGTAMIRMEFEGNRVFITLEDNGQKFNPLEQADPDITSSAEERDIGGLGIYMVKKTMDNMTYKYENNKNILTIEKVFKE